MKHGFALKQGVQQNAHTGELVHKLSKRFYWLRVAAILTIIAGGAWLATVIFNNPFAPSLALTKISTQKNTFTDTLPDGSVVTLNKNLGITYPTSFTGKRRNITLNGEAFFNVSTDKRRLFIIAVNDVTVKVVGTSFNIKSFEGKTEVIVETGIVEVEKKNLKVMLQSNEKVTVPNSDSTFTKENSTDKLYTYFRSKEFVCDATPLWKVVEVLNEAYDAQIIIEKKACGMNCSLPLLIMNL